MEENPLRFVNRKGKEYNHSDLSSVYHRAMLVYEKFTYCEICKQKILTKKMTRFRGKMVCPECLNRDECDYERSGMVSNMALVQEY